MLKKRSSEGLSVLDEPEEGSEVQGAFWSSDGLGLFLELRRSDDSRLLAILDLESGGVEELWAAPEGAFVFRPSADGKTVYFIQGVEETDLWLATFE